MSYPASLGGTIETSGVRRCLECGKCTAICPISQFDGGFSPRVTVGRALLNRDVDLLGDDRLWTCLNCLQCSQVCPANVDYSALTTAVRTEARRRGQAALCTHGEAIHVWMRLMMQPGLKQDRLGWMEEKAESGTRKAESGRSERSRGSQQRSEGGGDPAAFAGRKAEGRVPNSEFRSPNSDTLYFAGCAPYYDALFSPLGVSGTLGAQASVRVLNAIGIEPLVLADERCCGHDLLWEGDVDGFTQLALLNSQMIRASGVKRIVSSCPECVRTLRVDYPAHGIGLDAQVLHISELLLSASLPATPNLKRDLRVTFHDPCRLGRHLGIYDAPRQVLEHLGYEVVEMRHNRRNATCCGTDGWTHCGAANKAIQVRRLREAKATGADMMVTSCLKCQIHFRCALQDEHLRDEIGIEMVDLVELAADSLSRTPHLVGATLCGRPGL